MLNLFDIENAVEILNHSKVIAIGPVTAGILTDKKVKKVIVSKVHTVPGLMNTLLEIFGKN